LDFIGLDRVSILLFNTFIFFTSFSDENAKTPLLIELCQELPALTRTQHKRLSLLLE